MACATRSVALSVLMGVVESVDLDVVLSSVTCYGVSTVGEVEHCWSEEWSVVSDLLCASLVVLFEGRDVFAKKSVSDTVCWSTQEELRNI